MAASKVRFPSNVPIADKEGNPSSFFVRQLQVLLDEKQDIATTADGAATTAAGAVQTSDLLNALLSALGGDPAADKLFYWDDTTNTFKFLGVGTGLSVGSGNLNATATGGGSITKISDTTLVATATTLSFTSIPSTYTDLILMIYPVVTGTSSDHNVMLTFNSDTGANYDWAIWSRFEGANSGGQTSAKVGITGFDTAHEGPIEIQVFRYADTTRAEKLFRSESSGSGGGNYFRRLFDGSWHPATAAAINRIDINPNITLQIGTRAILYGRT
jgi:hypothetical protein